MTPFMKGPFRAPARNTYDDSRIFLDRDADMTPFMKGPFRAPVEHSPTITIYESGR